MAKIIFSDGSEIRGRVGGKIYSRNASGAYVRKYTKPVNPSTLLQNIVRNIFTIVSNHWRGLSAQDVASWEAMRPFYTTTDSVGNVVTPTASQLHARLNGKLLQNGLVNTSTLLTVCPTPIVLDSIVNANPLFDINGTDSFGQVTMGATGTIVPADCVLVVSATGTLSNGIKSVPANAFRRIKTLEAGDDTASEDLFPSYIAEFGTPQVGEVLHYKFELISQITGQYSNTLTAKVVTV